METLGFIITLLISFGFISAIPFWSHRIEQKMDEDDV
jgi:hypothetical protein